MKKVLIAHQSTIPHYRVPFYNALEKQRSDKWCFSVVFDHREFVNPIFYKEPLEKQGIQFPLLDVKTYSRKFKSTRISYQTFFREAAKYDLLIVENAVNNLTYPLTQLYQLQSPKFAYWGHGRDLSLSKHPGYIKKSSEALKMWLLKRANGFFAYTEGVKSHLLEKGVSAEKLFVVNNTIDIQYQRTYFNRFQSQREALRSRFGVVDKKVLIFVGRFNKDKRIDFLLEIFRCLVKLDPSWHLFMVGSGEIVPNCDGIESNVILFGSLTDLELLAPIYIASDLYILTGAVGLGALQANCYDLPVVAIESPHHGPEFEYLNSSNALILKSDSDEIEVASAVNQMFSDSEKLVDLRASVWPSIFHLTIEDMANRFKIGIDKLLFSE